MPYGITAAGFVAKPRDTILSELQVLAKAAWGDTNLDVSPDSYVGIFIGLIADQQGSLWDTVQGVIAESYPDGATGVSLERICSLTGITRKPATYSEVDVTLTGTTGTIVPAGTLFDSGVGTTQVATQASVTLVAGTGTAHCKATVTGAKYLLSGTLTRIVTPVSGLTGVLNALDQTVLGTALESDEDLRMRREISLQDLGGASLDAIRAEVLAINNVSECYVFENSSTTTDTDGLPAKSCEVVVRGGADADIAAAVLKTKAAGIYSYGTTTTTATDSAGTARTVRFSRPTAANIYVVVNVETYNQQMSDAALTALIQAAVVAQETAYKLGSDVVASKFVKSIFDTDSSVQNVASVYIGTSASPTTSATISIDRRHFADLDTSRVTVHIAHLGSV